MSCPRDTGAGLYSALALRGFFPREELSTLNRPNTNLPSHCDRLRTVGIDMSTGSLGQGFSCAVGMAVAGKWTAAPAASIRSLETGNLRRDRSGRPLCWPVPESWTT